LAGDKWLVMTSNGGIANNGVTIGSAPALGGGLAFAVEISDDGKVFMAVVPETGTGVLFALALALLRQRRTRV
jgi:hypothetical protein